MDPVIISWPGGEHKFALPIGRLRALQSMCDAGPLQILRGLQIGTWQVDWPFSVIRQGLIGGGMDDVEAMKLVAQMEEFYPCGRFVAPAAIILGAAVVGVDDDPVGEPQGAMNPPPTDGNSANITETALRADSPRNRSTE